nr:MAG TPA: hypothetical protein [Caudoviricetes sp.]DAQ30392.1 MAG TPA: hypothetical protein [Caudoviricetes sp.]
MRGVSENRETQNATRRIRTSNTFIGLWLTTG